MNKSRLKKELRQVGQSAVTWGHALFEAGLLPIDHNYIPRSNNTPRRQAIEDHWHDTMFKAYLDAAELAGQTRRSA